MNKRSMFLNVLVFIAYVALFGLLLFQVFSLPDKYNQEEMDMITEVEKAISLAVKVESDEVMVRNLEALRDDYDFDIVITRENEVIYHTIPYDYGDSLLSRSHPNAIARESQGLFNNGHEDLFMWYTVYRLNDSAFINAFLRTVIIIVIIVIVLLSLTVGLIAKTLFNPLRHIKKSIRQAKDYDFDAIEGLDDGINQSFKDFVSGLETSISSVSRQHTELEKQLQIKREHLNNIVLVSKSMVHDLKTPVYRNILENEVIAKEHYDNVELVKMAELNQELNHAIMLDINRILRMLKNDGEEFDIEKKDVDVIQVLMRAINSFNRGMSEKDLYLNFDAPDSLVIHTEETTLTLLINNLLSNMVLYAEEDSEMEIFVDMNEQELLLRFKNVAKVDNIRRMKDTEQLFNTIKDPEEGYVYSSGNGLFLIKELTNMLKGTYHLDCDEHHVIIEVRIHHEA